MAELHFFGSPPLADTVLRTLCQNGARVAEPGEFTLRAFLGGRIDLTQAEAVLGVIDAQNDKELNVALRQMAGGLTRPLENLRNELIDLLADLEAGLDFVEDDIEFVTADVLAARLVQAQNDVNEMLTQIGSRLLYSDGARAVLTGCPLSLIHI